MAVRQDELLVMRAITKDFPGVRALDQVDFVLRRGEIHGLVGANGAGKSTLMKVLAGVFPDYEGSIILNGRPVRIRNPRQALNLGIAVIHQEFQLVPKLTVAENLLLGSEPLRRVAGIPFMDKRALFEKAQQILTELGFNVPLRAQVCELGVADQQLVQIAKAMAARARVLVMDEPTARLSRTERDALFEVMRRLATTGTGIVYISHFLEEVFMVADVVTVLRDGRNVGTLPTRELRHAQLVKMMLGREISDQAGRKPSPSGPELLRVENLSCDSKFHGVSFYLRGGEILGIAGLVGSGRTELARALFGADREHTEGRILVEGRPFQPASPRAAIARGMALVPEDRKQQGLVLIRPVSDNISVTVVGQMRRWLFLDLRARSRFVREMISRLRIKCPSPAIAAAALSGGNQQKVVLAKWLASGPQILILDQPTAGIDVGTKEEIYRLLDELARAGKGIIVISDDPGELARVCDRVLIMRKGRMVRELTRPLSSEEVLAGVTAEY